MRLSRFSFLFLFICELSALDSAVEYAKPAHLNLRPKREVSVIVTKEGYYPDKFSFFEGEEVKFFVTSLVDTPHCLVVSKHDLFIAANRNKINEGSVTFDQPGVFNMYCPSEKIGATITVLQKEYKRIMKPFVNKEMAESNNNKNVKRDISSKEWMPKDY